MNKNRVYSTEQGKICPACDQPVERCKCRSRAASARANETGDGIVRIHRETKGRKGAGVSIVRGLKLDQGELKALAKTLKQRCGSGGAVKAGEIEIQGDHRDSIKAELEKQGFVVKLAGG